MVHEVDQAMLAMCAAIASRSQYGDDHPVPREHEARAAQWLAVALERTSPVLVLMLGELVAFQNQPLPSSAKLSGAIGALLQRHGVECISFERGVTAGDIRRLLDQLCAAASGAPLQSSATVRLAMIESDVAPGHVRLSASATSGGSKWGPALASLERAWDGVLEHGDGTSDRLVGIVADICSVLGTDRAILAPLTELKTHDEYTYVHTINVGLTTACLAREIGFAPDLMHDVTLAALLHDLGKRLIPKEILLKNGPLDERELAIVRRHPVEGARLIMEAGDLPPIASIVALEHHMNLDGTGYPAQPKSWQIHPASQVVHVADVFDALRTHRPYRAAMSLDEAVAIMSKHAGVWFERDVFDVFVARVANRCDEKRTTTGGEVVAKAA